MAELSGFFDAEELVDGTYDREYVAEQFANYFKQFVSNGVFVNPTNQLKVQSNSGMTVRVLAGWAWINGYWYQNNADLILTIPANASAETVKHGIFVRYDSSERTISIVIGNGRTTVNRTAPYYELKLAEITVAPGTSAISTADITDTRGLSSVCGFVKGVVDVIDTDDLFEQFTAIFEDWFNHMKDQLDTDAAGHLQLEIDDESKVRMLYNCKNILPFDIENMYDSNTEGTWDKTTNTYTRDGVSYAIQDDGTVIINREGTSSANSSFYYYRKPEGHSVPAGVYRFCGLPATGSSSTFRLRYCLYYADGTNTGWKYITNEAGADITVGENCIGLSLGIVVYSTGSPSNQLWELMICLKSDYDIDSSYMPYAKTNLELTRDKISWNELKKMGSVNLAPSIYGDTVSHGVTYTKNANGTVDTSGTATGGSAIYYFVQFDDNYYLPAGTYRLTGCPSGGASNTYYLRVSRGNGALAEDYGEGVVFTISEDTNIAIVTRVTSGNSLNDTIKPMIAPIDYNGDYVPFAQTNKQLTDRAAAIEQDASFQNIDTHMLTHKYHLTLVHSDSYRVSAQIISPQGNLFFSHSGSVWVIPEAVVLNRDPSVSTPVWTYSINGETLEIDCSKQIDGILLIGGATGKAHNVTITLGTSKNPQANTIEAVSLQGDIGFNLEDTKTLSTSGSLVFTFQDSRITADSEITPYSSIYGFVPSSIETSAGQCVVTFPAYSSAVSLKCRIWVRN